MEIYNWPTVYYLVLLHVLGLRRTRSVRRTNRLTMNALAILELASTWYDVRYQCYDYVVVAS